MRITLVFLLVATIGCAKDDDSFGPSTVIKDTHTEEVHVYAAEDLAAFAPFGKRVQLDWTDASEDEEGYRIARSCTPADGADADGFCVLVEIDADSVRYQDHTAQSGQTHSYRVTAYAGEVEESADVEVETPPTMETSILPEPQGAWFLGEEGQSMAMPSSVNIDSNVEFETLRILLRSADPYSLPARFEAAGRIRCISGMIVSPVYVWQGKSWSFGRPGRSPLV